MHFKFYYALILERTNRLKEAQKIITQVKDSSGLTLKFKFIHAKVLWREGKLEEALKVATEVSEAAS